MLAYFGPSGLFAGDAVLREARDPARSPARRFEMARWLGLQTTVDPVIRREFLALCEDGDSVGRAAAIRNSSYLVEQDWQEQLLHWASHADATVAAGAGWALLYHDAIKTDRDRLVLALRQEGPERRKLVAALRAATDPKLPPPTWLELGPALLPVLEDRTM